MAQNVANQSKNIDPDPDKHIWDEWSEGSDDTLGPLSSQGFWDQVDEMQASQNMNLDEPPSATSTQITSTPRTTNNSAATLVGTPVTATPSHSSSHQVQVKSKKRQADEIIDLDDKDDDDLFDGPKPSKTLRTSGRQTPMTRKSTATPTNKSMTKALETPRHRTLGSISKALSQLSSSPTPLDTPSQNSRAASGSGSRVYSIKPLPNGTNLNRGVVTPTRTRIPETRLGLGLGQSSRKPPTKTEQPQEIICIAHDHRLQVKLDGRGSSWGVCWELARYMCLDKKFLLQPSEFHELTVLDGENEKGALVGGILKAVAAKREGVPVKAPAKNYFDDLTQRAYAEEQKIKECWEELNAEDKALEAQDQSGLGCMPNSKWYGGKVCQVAKLVANMGVDRKTASIERLYSFRLEKQVIGRSHRLSRFCGSRHVLQVSIPLAVINMSGNRLQELFLRPLGLMGRKFEAIFAKEKTVYLVETGDFDRKPSGEIDAKRKTLFEIINWHNSLKLNSEQVMAKWATRFALALSTSVPTLRIEPENLIQIADEVSPLAGPGKPSSEYILTDGCGFYSRAVADVVKNTFNLRTRPAAVQGRICGAKGMFMLDPADTSEDLKIWYRDSQRKIVINKPDISQLTLDLVRPLRLKYPARLSAEIIVNLGHNGVSVETIKTLFKEGIKTEIEPLINWEGEGAMFKLWLAVFRRGHVGSMRLRRHAGGAARAFGFGENDDDDDGIDEDALEDPTERAVAWHPDQISGLPSTLEESVMAFIASGFHPNTCPRLRFKLLQVVNTTITTYIKRFRVGIPQSAEGFALPDPTRKLKPGQIYCRSSTPWLDHEGNWQDTIQGEVLITRHPCKVESDVQKFTAVDCPELRSLLDVVIFSVQDSRSPLSRLGGGDYDGDTVLLNWHPEIVKSFRVPLPRENGRCAGDPPPGFVEQNFIRGVETVDAFRKRTQALNTAGRTREIQKYLLSSLVNTSIVGSYSKWHDLSIYLNGYAHPDTERLAYMFCTCLDASKSGLTVKPEVRRRDKIWASEFCNLPWRQAIKADDEAEWGEERHQGTKIPMQPLTLAAAGPFIMDALREVGVAQMHEFEAGMNYHAHNVIDRRLCRDDDLIQPFKEAEEQAAEETSLYGTDHIRSELETLMDIVRQNRIQHREAMKPKATKGLSKTTFTGVHIVNRQDTLRKISSGLHSRLHQHKWIALQRSSVLTIAASFAYKHDLDMQNESGGAFNQGTGYPWDVMFRELALLKARKSGSASTVTTEFYELFEITKHSIKLL